MSLATRAVRSNLSENGPNDDTRTASARTAAMTSRGVHYWSNGAIPLIGPDVLGDILSHAADLSVVISDMGEVLSVLVHPDHSTHGLLDGWVGRDIRTVLTSESVEKFDRHLARINAGEPDRRGTELNHVETRGLGFPVRYSFHRIGPDGAILMLGRDLRPVAEMQQQLVEAQLALERDYEHQREITTRMSALMETTRDAIVFVNGATGRIASLNGRAAQILGATMDELQGTPFATRLTGGDGPLDLARLAAAARGDGSAPLRAQVAGGPRSVALHATPFRAAGERMYLCRLDRDSGTAEPTGAAGARLARFFDRSPDALVFTDRSGHILSANDAFLDLAGRDSAAALKGVSLAEFLARGGVDLKVLTDNAVRNGQMRLYATRVAAQFGDETPVEISVAHLDDAANPALGFVLRDVSRAEGLRAPAGAALEDVRPTRDLVGAATLKEIVAETTEVIEKMCIETAVELTGNNRMAAAEMLGLSRQSLYVKLRKYGLLARED